MFTKLERPGSRTAGFLRRQAARGFTLVELMMSIGCSGIVFAAVALCSLYTAKNFAGVANYVDLDTASRLALDKISKDIRQSKSVSSCTATQLTLVDADGGSLQFVFNSGAKTLTRVKGGVSTVLLRDCEAFAFAMYQRNPIGGTYDQYPTATAATCKLVSMSWSCARSILGHTRNSESVQTAKVVIRKNTSKTL